MALTISGSFQCYALNADCEAKCETGKCYFADVCNGQPNAYFCSSYNPYILIFGVLTVVAFFLLLCLGGVGYFMWRRIHQMNNERKQKKYVFPQMEQVAAPRDHDLTPEVQTKF
ncbi:hypothetical protein L596_014267 [Steinernema carpocapsae]|uniref:Uncharacterized protein n=1 Tax=Steinernema carpocapsae TaxID=34508 RepID=A0A4U5NBC9_STECR|nr:hypothetical protein L596_014267 [Steinernema carpocapsae]